PTTASALADTLKLPVLLQLLHDKMGFGNLVSIQNTGSVRIELHGILQITTELFQTDYLEVLKVSTSLPSHLQTRVVQDAVFFEDCASSNGDFGNHAIGRVLGYIT